MRRWFGKEDHPPVGETRVGGDLVISAGRDDRWVWERELGNP